ncbi:hypothetical protein BDB01DRAFT_853260 [Pilobolus umbonatus]|nr:hypothetical protein BDB01DRAFT_853260 [Pilobolus umbonatus]
MDEYHLKNKGNNKLHNPPIKNNRRRTMKALGLKESRSLLYKGERTVEAHPQPLDKYIDLATIRPEHIPRAILFLEHELPLITGIEDQFVVDQIVNILLVPYHDKKKHMDDPFILHELAEWLKNDGYHTTTIYQPSSTIRQNDQAQQITIFVVYQIDNKPHGWL